MSFKFFVTLSFLSSHTIPRHIICNFPVLILLYIYISVNSWYLNKPDEEWYWPVEISQLNSISRCLISPCKSLLDCNVFTSTLFKVIDRRLPEAHCYTRMIPSYT